MTGSLSNRLFLGLLCGVAIIASSLVDGVRPNLSPSVPLGLYQLRPPTFEAGDLVVVCFETWSDDRLLPGSCPSGHRPLFKRLAAVAGDQVEASPAGVLINGALYPNSAALSVDSRGRPLSSFQRTLVLPHDAAWLMGEHPSSYDSRYFGPISRKAIRHSARPLWTWAPGSSSSSIGVFDD